MVLQRLQQQQMIQELEEQSDELLERLSHISHLWSLVLIKDKETGNYFVDTIRLHGFHVLDLGSHTYCIVGEAHGFDDKYVGKCTRCERYSQNLYMFLGDDPGNNDIFSRQLRNFVSHFETVHKTK
jgi:hypothetical protein